VDQNPEKDGPDIQLYRFLLTPSAGTGREIGKETDPETIFGEKRVSRQI
jgi:hypothetical protein